MRALALAASLALVVTHWQERDAWLWVGLALVVLNVVGLVANRQRPAGVAPPAESVREDDGSVTLLDLLREPGVAAALAGGPARWRQVSHLSERFDPMGIEEVVGYVWLECEDDGWSIGLGEELKPFLDLDLDELDDPAVAVLRGHRDVDEAWHEDREVYRVRTRHPLGVIEFAGLAARALVSHHDTVSRDRSR